MFEPTRAAGLAALDRFVPQAGAPYSMGRNYDLDAQGGGAVSQLSPYIRHRLITEPEVIRAVLALHSPKTAEKFLQEVFWRTYWKGWLQMRPSVWTAYKAQLLAGINRLQTESGLRAQFDAACTADTDIECFNDWSQQLVQNGYLHNHARMWFASIWVFTLRLPWALGADFFMRHLLDGDPASNTLSWRWVAGLQTKGKTYLATAENIETFTRGRFKPHPNSLSSFAASLEGPDHPARVDIPPSATPQPGQKTGLMVHDDDMLADHIATPHVARCFLSTAADRSPLKVSSRVESYVAEALVSAGASAEDRFDLTPNRVVDWAFQHQLQQVVTPFAPVGPTADALDQIEQQLNARHIPLIRVMRQYDQACWPKATHGFFRFKEHIPDFIANI